MNRLYRTLSGRINGIRMVTKRQGITKDCLAFADDLALFSEIIQGAKEQITSLQEQAAKVGLQIAFEKTNFITNIEPPPKHLNIGETKVMRVKKFKYLGEWVETYISEKEALTSRLNKMEQSYQLTKQTYKRISMSINAKLTYYNTDIRREGLYGGE